MKSKFLDEEMKNEMTLEQWCKKINLLYAAEDMYKALIEVRNELHFNPCHLECSRAVERAIIKAEGK